MKTITIDELLSMPRTPFIERMEAWIKEFNNGEQIEIEDTLDCPLHQWVVHNKAKCRQETVGNTLNCPICGNPCCPDCMNHKVTQLSRVTGYLSGVDGWNAAKKQEFKDRQRHTV